MLVNLHQLERSRMASRTVELDSIAYDKLFTSKGDDCYLGAGTFSQVFRCYHPTLGDVAVKILNASTRNPIPNFNKEGLLHLKANTCSNILTIHGIAQCGAFVGLVLDYMRYGSLSEAIYNEDIELPWTFRLRALSEIAAGTAYLHNLTNDRRVVHCDLKVENILLNDDLHIKIGDFGGATLACYTGASIKSTTTGNTSIDEKQLQYTLSYAAPELLDQLDSKRTPYMDIYSFAIVTYVVASREIPFKQMPLDVIKHAVKEGQRPRRSLNEVEEDLIDSDDKHGTEVLTLFKDLMEKCWVHGPRERMPMKDVRDKLQEKLKTFPEAKVAEDILKVKKLMRPGKTGMPENPTTVHEKYKELLQTGQLGPLGRTSQHQTPPHTTAQPSGNVRAFASQPRSLQAQPAASTPRPTRDTQPKESRGAVPGDVRRKVEPKRPDVARAVSSGSGIRELESSFTDPYLRLGNPVRMIADVAAIKNAQVGHGGWKDSLLKLRDMQGVVTRVEDNGDVTVSFSGIKSHRFNPSSLVKIPSETDLHVGDFVVIELEKALVEVLQEGHGGWVDEMHQYFSQLGLIFRFLPERDVLVVYKNGVYFRFNTEVLCKSKDAEAMSYLSLGANPNIKIGDYVCHDLEDDVLKELQENGGGWNSAMSELRGRVGKFVYVDYHGRAFIAYSSKLCFVFNPAAINKLTPDEALRRFRNFKDEAKKQAKAKAVVQTRHHRFAVGDRVRVHLPLDILVELQKGHGGWCYQMLEVYGQTGTVKEFDDGDNAQVLFTTGNKWTFNSASLERVEPGDTSPPPSYVPPFKIGDKVRVRLKDHNNASLNKMRHVLKLLDIPDDKVDILTKTGTVLGIDDDIDVIVSFGDSKNYGLKPSQLEKIN